MPPPAPALPPLAAAAELALDARAEEPKEALWPRPAAAAAAAAATPLLAAHAPPPPPPLGTIAGRPEGVIAAATTPLLPPASVCRSSASVAAAGAAACSSVDTKARDSARPPASPAPAAPAVAGVAANTSAGSGGGGATARRGCGCVKSCVGVCPNSLICVSSALNSSASRLSDVRSTAFCVQGRRM
eukprot:351494-Chlamydomonas_euryale.AAC.4